METLKNCIGQSCFDIVDGYITDISECFFSQVATHKYVRILNGASGLAELFAEEYKSKIVKTDFKKRQTTYLFNEQTSKWEIVSHKKILPIVKAFTIKIIDEYINDLQYVKNRELKNGNIFLFIPDAQLLAAKKIKNSIAKRETIKEIWTAAGPLLFESNFKELNEYY